MGIFKKWQKEAKGFGTVICLSVNIDNLWDMISLAENDELMAGVVHDPEYKYSVPLKMRHCMNQSIETAKRIITDKEVIMFRDEITCGYIFVSEDAPIREFLNNFPLHP